MRLPDNFKQTNLYLDQDVVFLATKKLTGLTGNKRMLSSFVNRILEEFVLEGDREETSISQMARELTEKIRHEKLAQRKLIHESIEKQTDRDLLIQKETQAALHKLEFRKEWMRDRPGYNFSHHREELADQVSIACRLDLTWKELMPVVSAIVLEGGKV